VFAPILVNSPQARSVHRLGDDLELCSAASPQSSLRTPRHVAAGGNGLVVGARCGPGVLLTGSLARAADPKGGPMF